MPYPSKLSESQILDEAVRIVDEHGVAGLSTRVLAGRLQVRAPSLYRYFPDMEALVQAVTARFLIELAAELEGCSTLAEMGRAYWDYGMRYPNRYAILVYPRREAEDPPIEVKLQTTQPLHRLAARLDPDHPLETARMLWSYLHGAVSLRLNWPTRPGLDPDEAFVAGLEAFEWWFTTGRDAGNAGRRHGRGTSGD